MNYDNFEVFNFVYLFYFMGSVKFAKERLELAEKNCNIANYHFSFTATNLLVKGSKDMENSAWDKN